jgi:hypothetical protein
MKVSTTEKSKKRYSISESMVFFIGFGEVTGKLTLRLYCANGNRR